MHGMPSIVQVITILRTYVITSTKLLSVILAHKVKHRTQVSPETYIYHKSQLNKLKDMLTLNVFRSYWST